MINLYTPIRSKYSNSVESWRKITATLVYTDILIWSFINKKKTCFRFVFTESQGSDPDDQRLAGTREYKEKKLNISEKKTTSQSCIAVLYERTSCLETNCRDALVMWNVSCNSYISLGKELQAQSLRTRWTVDFSYSSMQDTERNRTRQSIRHNFRDNYITIPKDSFN